jgi:hypothetical protein
MSRLLILGAVLVAATSLAPVRSSAQEAQVQISQFCSPKNDPSPVARLREWLSNQTHGLNEIPSLEMVVLKFDASSDELPEPDLWYLGSFYVVGPRNNLLAVCAPAKVFPSDPRVDPAIDLTQQGTRLPALETGGRLVAFDVWTNCGTGCAYAGVYLVRFEEGKFSEYYVINTGANSDLMLRSCPLEHGFAVEELEISEPVVRGRLFMSIRCGDKRSACLFKRAPEQIELATGSGIGLFETTGIAQFSVDGHPKFEKFVEQHERFLGRPDPDNPIPDVCSNLELPLPAEKMEKLKGLGATHFMVDGIEYPVL